MNVNDKVKLLRNTHQLTQEEMASRLGINTNSYAKLERGETRLSVDRLEQIANIFEVDLMELMSLGEKNVVYFNDNSTNNGNGINLTLPNKSDSSAIITTKLTRIRDKQKKLKKSPQI